MDITTEEWRDIPGYEGRYQASTLGRIRSVDRIVYSRNRYTGAPFPRKLKGRILRPGRVKTGHLYVVLGRKAAGSPVHELVMRTFIGAPPKNTEVCHNDGDPTNNALINLRYDSRKSNVLDMYLIGHGKNKLNPEQVREVRKDLSQGHSATSIAAKQNVGPHVIYGIKQERTYQWVK